MIPLRLSIPDDVVKSIRTPRVVASVSGLARACGVRVKQSLLVWAVITVCALALPNLSFAGTGGTEFTVAYTTLTGWLQGDLGRLIAASLLVVGLVMGVVRQSIMAAVPAIACGLVATVAPTIIGAVVTAVI